MKLWGFYIKKHRLFNSILHTKLFITYHRIVCRSDAVQILSAHIYCGDLMIIIGGVITNSLGSVSIFAPFAVSDVKYQHRLLKRLKALKIKENLEVVETSRFFVMERANTLRKISRFAPKTKSKHYGVYQALSGKAAKALCKRSGFDLERTPIHRRAFRSATAAKRRHLARRWSSGMSER